VNHSKTHVLDELVRRGLLPKSAIMDGDLVVADSTSRHRNALVIRRGAPGYFVKEAIPTQSMSLQTLMREAATYAHVQQANGALAPLAALMPRFHLFDPQQHLLVLELLPDAENLSTHARRTQQFSETLSAEFGRALATYHRRAAGTLTMASHGHIFPGAIPWALTLSRQAESSIANISGANTQMLSLIKRYPDFPRRLDALQAGWRRDTLIHGDLKFENCVVFYPDGPDGAPKIRVVDWEIADIGDPRWDVGSMLQAWLCFWIFSMPADGAVTDPSQLAARAQFPIERMQPAMRAFWRAYAETMEITGTAARDLLDTCAAFGAARMVQTVFESMHQMPQLTPHAIFLLQVSLNVLEQPRAAVSELLGL
jgi:thiamine kinase-like enzyme